MVVEEGNLNPSFDAVSDNQIKGNDDPERSKGKKMGKKIIAVTIAGIVIIAAIGIYWAISPDGLGILDSDGDGVSDGNDAFPNDSNEWADSDNDGVGDNTDAFPNDPSETVDTDGDGHGDNSDAFPNDSNEWVDSDLDGVGNNADAFPYDPTEYHDADGDGYGDNSDAFPQNSNEWSDKDMDGIGDNADIYDEGNAMIRIKILEYSGDNSADFWTNGDPYFVIKVDRSNSGFFDYVRTSSVYTDTEFLSNPYSITVDIDDDQSTIRFCILVYDSDTGGSQVIDYCPSSSGTYYIHTVNAPYTSTWQYSGGTDNIDEIDCTLRYSISLT